MTFISNQWKPTFSDIIKCCICGIRMIQFLIEWAWWEMARYDNHNWLALLILTKDSKTLQKRYCANRRLCWLSGGPESVLSLTAFSNLNRTSNSLFSSGWNANSIKQRCRVSVCLILYHEISRPHTSRNDTAIAHRLWIRDYIHNIVLISHPLIPNVFKHLIFF